MFKQRQAYSAILPTAFSVSQTAVDKWDKSEDDGAGCLHCQQPKMVQLPLVSQKSKFCLKRISSQNKNLCHCFIMNIITHCNTMVSN